MSDRATCPPGPSGPRRSAGSAGTAAVPTAAGALACLLALALAVLMPDAAAQPVLRDSDAGADGAASAEAAPAQGIPDAAAAITHRDADPGSKQRAHSPERAEVPIHVPHEWMPPGTNVSAAPSEAIFPTQSITLHFNHNKHVVDLKLACAFCHGEVYKSGSAEDRNLPRPTATCDTCHDVDHASLDNVSTGGAPNGRCDLCHVAERDGKVARLVLPKPNLRFPHDKHLARNIQCGQCHGAVGKLRLATRDQLPRMAGCFKCHDMSGAAQGQAKGECVTCHTTQPDGRLRTAFPSGPLVPPRWLHGAGHGPDWIERHKGVAGANSALCSSCHSASDCSGCHDGRVRPRRVHPNDWLSMHPQAARQDNPRCVSCHQLQTFCADCHRRTGVARDGPSATRPAGERFHPPPAEWTTAPRGAKHHAWEAERNINACVACHSERDCATCHATKGVSGGGGVSPHPLGFSAKCSTALRRNPRPCLVCHVRNDRFLGACR